MPVLPIDLTAIVAIVMGMLVVLIPIAGITARFAIKPIAEALVHMRESSVDRQQLQLLERRLSLIEQEINGLGGMRDDLQRALAEVEFERQLKAPPAGQ